MPIGPTTYFRKERIFVDRELCLQAFRENIQNSETKDYNILFYHGIAGIGKTELQKELQNILNKEYPKIVWVSIDLENRTHREVGTFLITLRNKISEKYKIKFYLFNTIHAIYQKKLHPELPIQKENYSLIEEGGFFSEIIHGLDKYTFLPVRLLFDIINNAPDHIQKIFTNMSIDIHKLADMEAYEIEKILPGSFAADFTACLDTSSKVYIFIDTYEALWEDLRNKGSFHKKDEWIRDNLIPNMLGVSWVICGREKLLWETEYDPDWKLYLEQHNVDELPKNYCTEFLDDCGIENKVLLNKIITASERVPYYLNLSVDTYEKINQSRQPVPEDFGKTQPEIFNMFVKYLYDYEIRALKVLSAPNFWDQDLFEILMKKFDPGFPTGAFSELIKFSFIKVESDGRYSIHQLMRKSLQQYQNSDYRKNIHKFLFEHYKYKLKDTDTKTITKERKIALMEAFYHAKESLEAEELLNWFINVSDPFYKAAFWQLILPIYNEMLQILTAKLGSEHQNVATILNTLAGLYKDMGDYEKALPLYQKALDIRETVLGPQHPYVSDGLNGLVGLYCHMGDYETAIPLYQKALEIRETVLGTQHPDVATTLNDLAELYDYMGDHEKALSLYERIENNSDDSRIAFEEVIGTNPQDSTAWLDKGVDLGGLGKYNEALKAFEKAIEISPQNSLAWAGKGMALCDLERYDEAMKTFDKSIEINPQDYYAWYSKASALSNLNKYDEALKAFDKSIEINPRFSAAWTDKGGILERLGKYDEALNAFDKALEINPQESLALEGKKTLSKLIK